MLKVISFCKTYILTIILKIYIAENTLSLHSACSGTDLIHRQWLGFKSIYLGEMVLLALRIKYKWGKKNGGTKENTWQSDHL